MEREGRAGIAHPCLHMGLLGRLLTFWHCRSARAGVRHAELISFLGPGALRTSGSIRRVCRHVGLPSVGREPAARPAPRSYAVCRSSVFNHLFSPRQRRELAGARFCGQKRESRMQIPAWP